MRETMKDVNTKLGYIDAKLEELEKKIYGEEENSSIEKDLYVTEILSTLKEAIRILSGGVEQAYDFAEIAEGSASEAKGMVCELQSEMKVAQYDGTNL